MAELVLRWSGLIAPFPGSGYATSLDKAKDPGQTVAGDPGYEVVDRVFSTSYVHPTRDDVALSRHPLVALLLPALFSR
jgi:hypothetical protein